MHVNPSSKIDILDPPNNNGSKNIHKKPIIDKDEYIGGLQLVRQQAEELKDPFLFRFTNIDLHKEYEIREISFGGSSWGDKVTTSRNGRFLVAWNDFDLDLIDLVSKNKIHKYSSAKYACFSQILSFCSFWNRIQ